MSGVSKKLMGTTAAGGGFTAIEDVFSTYLYTGNGSTQTITNDIDLAGEGGLVWIKERTGIRWHVLTDSERGVGSTLFSNDARAEELFDHVTSLNSDGFGIKDVEVNGSGQNYASWTFRKAPRFFDVVTYTGDGVAGREIPHNLGTTVGTIIVKSTSDAVDWAVYHRSLGATKYLNLNLTNEGITNPNFWNDTEPTSTHFTVAGTFATNRSGFTYVAYLYAHDPLGPSGDGSDGLIACGSYTGNESTFPVIDLGWEPQWVFIKAASRTGNWQLFDNMRGIVSGGADPYLWANTADAESLNNDYIDLYPTGFGPSSIEASTNATGETFIYIAIRRGPMRAPESGTEVFAVENGNGGGSATNPEFVSGFPVDAALIRGLGVANNQLYSRLTANKYLSTDQTDAEITNASAFSMASNEGWYLGSTTWTSWMFRRAPNFFDVVAYTGTGSVSTFAHNLGVKPQMIWTKGRNDSTFGWYVYHEAVTAEDQLYLHLTNAAGGGFMNNTEPTDEVFTLGVTSGANASGEPFIAYLFATLAGVSKVGSYTGNGTSQTINCGFTSSARFLIIKRTDSTGDWYVWDTARGIVAANDPHLSLNTTAAEVTTDDSIDPDSSGFIVNQVAATNINVSAASYIFYAVS